MNGQPGLLCFAVSVLGIVSLDRRIRINRGKRHRLGHPIADSLIQSIRLLGHSCFFECFPHGAHKITFLDPVTGRDFGTEASLKDNLPKLIL